MSLSCRLMLIATLGVLSTPAWAEVLGKPAPPLQVSKWIKGDPAILAECRGKCVFVVEFWGTTCPHSRACVPHLTKMQRKYQGQDVVLIGISTEPAEKVGTFVNEMGEQMEYLVGVDAMSATASSYFRGILDKKQIKTPYAFVVAKDGNLVWHGHPMSGLDKTIAAVVAGTHDIEAARKLEQARLGRDLYIQSVKSPGKVKATAKDPATGEQRLVVEQLGESIITDGRDDFLLMNDFAWKIATEPGLIKRDLELAMRAAQIAYDATEGKNVEVLDTYARVLYERGQKEEAIKYQREALKLATTDEARQMLQRALTRYEKAAEPE